MLKPKRKITKQELKKDPFLEFLNDSQEWFQSNKKMVYQVGLAVIVLFVALFFIKNNNSKSTVESNALLGKAQLYQDLGDLENAKFQLQALVDDFEGTDAGTEGKYYLGTMLITEGNIDLGKEYLEDFVKKGKNELLKTTAYKKLAEIAVKNQSLDEAEKLLQKGVKTAENTVYENEMQIALANQLFINGKVDKASEIVDDILNQSDILFAVKKTAEELQGRLKR